MAGYIPQNLLDEILNRLDIVELISGYFPLKRAGRNFKALCPFHHEKTPSFMVNPQRQIFHCFGCAKGGNAFSFLMEYEHMDFMEAVKILAAKTAVVLPQPGIDNKTSGLISNLYKINELACRFYQNILNFFIHFPVSSCKSPLGHQQLNRSHAVRKGILPHQDTQLNRPCLHCQQESS